MKSFLGFKKIAIEKEKRMNAKQANQISIRNYLETIGINPIRNNKSYSLYLAPYRAESNPSLKVSHDQNLWVDYGNDNKGGTLIDLVLLLNPSYDVSDAICAIEKSNQSFFSFHQQESGPALITYSKRQIAIGKKQSTDSSIIKIRKIDELGQNAALTSYLKSRGIRLEIAKPYCKEIYYEIRGRHYFGIANETSHGWNIRNKYWKGCNGQGYSYYKNDSQNLNVFEGIFDLLSYIELQNSNPIQTDFMVLNSLVNLKRAIPIIEKYHQINIFLDYDQAGRNATKMLMGILPDSRDSSSFYSSFKDLNDYYLAKNNCQLSKVKY